MWSLRHSGFYPCFEGMLIPMFHQDSERPLPEAVFQFRTQLAQVDAWLIVTSEYSNSLSGALTNAIVRAVTPSPAMGGAIPLVKLDRSWRILYPHRVG